MSFYVYYGKLDNELLVTVLPNGTVEHGDSIYLYSKKKFSSYKIKEVSATDDGEDVVTFNDGYYSYEAVSKKAYKELSLTVTSAEAKSSKVLLTRQYDQPLTAIPLSDPPKIWTGAIDFHQWAKNESFFVITPKGLGNGKPVVAIWQWTEDAKGAKRTLSYWTGKQESAAASSSEFSFKQGDYYTLKCKINSSTNGLGVTIQSPSNPDAVQKELVLSAKVELGAEHSFAPPRPSQQQVTFDCSLPRATASLPRITSALPFPADLVQTLAHSAAYVDQAGYLAKYAVKQFEQLDKSFHLSEKKSEVRAAKVAKLEDQVTQLSEDKKILQSQNVELQRQITENNEIATKTQARLEKELRDALTALSASEAHSKKLEAYIDADKLADIRREKEHARHEAEDHKAIDLANKKLKEANETICDLRHDLQIKNKTIIKLEASLNFTQEQLGDAKSLIGRIGAELTVEKSQRAEIQKDLDDEIHLHNTAKKNLAQALRDVADKDAALKSQEAELERKIKDLKETEDTYIRAKTERDIKTEELKALKLKSEKEIKELRAEIANAESHDEDHHKKAPKSGTVVREREIVY
jgi:hypothetical protein